MYLVFFAIFDQNWRCNNYWKSSVVIQCVTPKCPTFFSKKLEKWDTFGTFTQKVPFMDYNKTKKRKNVGHFGVRHFGVRHFGARHFGVMDCNTVCLACSGFRHWFPDIDFAQTYLFRWLSWRSITTSITTSFTTIYCVFLSRVPIDDYKISALLALLLQKHKLTTKKSY